MFRRCRLARGWTKSLHGALPLPAPATLALLEGVPIRYVDDVEKELVTPTGAVLLTSIAQEFGGFPAMTLGRVGMGSGRRELPFPNVVRVWLGEAPSRNDGLIVETLTLLETNIDDLNPQVYEHVLNRLFDRGRARRDVDAHAHEEESTGDDVELCCAARQMRIRCCRSF